MIYADYNSSATICGEVKEYLVHRLETGPFANPSSIHRLGSKVLMGMENARSICAEFLGAKPSQLIFNSGATEGISTVFNSILTPTKMQEKPIFIISGLEHSAVYETASHYKALGFELKILPVFENGVVDFETLEKWVNEYHDKLAMVSIMAANNETGVIQPYLKISQICRKAEVLYFCDTTQLIGKTSFNFQESGLDYAVCSGHKIGALPGTGILLCKDKTFLKPLVIGAGQEGSLRGGTQNYLGNETLAVAMNRLDKKLADFEAMASKRIEFEKRIKESFPPVVILGETAPRLANTTYISYPGIHGQAVQIELESQDIYVTTSSACSDNEPSTSKVLKSMNVSDDVGRGVIRISYGPSAAENFYDRMFTALSSAYTKLMKIKSF